MHRSHGQSIVTPGAAFGKSLQRLSSHKADHYPSSYQYHHTSLEASACPHPFTHAVTDLLLMQPAPLGHDHAVLHAPKVPISPPPLSSVFFTEIRRYFIHLSCFTHLICVCVGVISHLLDLFQPVVEGFPFFFFFLCLGFSLFGLRVLRSC